MATIEELVQMVNTLQGQQHALNQEISQLTAENQQFRQAGSPGLADIATADGQTVQTAISSTNLRWSERSTMFKGESARFTVQIHVAFLALTESEKASISFLEQHQQVLWRCDVGSVVWDPLSGGQRRALLQHMWVPEQSKIQDLPAGLEKWEELVRRHETCKSSETTTAALHENIVSSELEQQLLFSFQQVRNEIRGYIEARRRQFAFKTLAAKSTSDPMDVDSFGKGGKKGNKGGNVASFETPGRSPHLDPEGWLRCTYDTGAAISAFPLDAKIVTETEANRCLYKTASRERSSDHSGLCLQKTSE